MHDGVGRGRIRSVGGTGILAGAALGVVIGLDVAGALDGVGSIVVGGLALAGVMLGIRLHRPRPSWPWWGIAGALTLFLGGMVSRNVLHTLGDLGPHRSLVPDVVVLPGYVVLAFALLGLSRSATEGRRHRIGIALDGTIAALSMLACAWVFLIDPILFAHSTPLANRIALIAYPTASIFLVVVTMRVAFSPTQERAPSYWFLMATMCAMFVGDTLYMLVEIHVADIPVPVLVLPYCLALLGGAATALHPSMRTLTEPIEDLEVRSSTTRVIVIAMALAIPAFLTLQVRRAAITDRLVLFGIVIALTGAAVVRIVEALHTAERSKADLAYQATHDTLTGLPNRRMMERHLSHALGQIVDDSQVGLLFIDLDRFKLVNDTVGHTHGDELLVEVATRLQAYVRPDDLVTRIGGDEFMIVLGQVVSISQALELANRLRAKLREPFTINGIEFYVSASIGLAFASGDDPHADVEALVRDADTAMYQAKDAGRDAVAVFDQSMRLRVTERVELEQELRHAVERHQLQLVYQPIVALPHGPIMGVEVLARWSHPTLGVISPAKFIPIAEENGLIVDIGEWVLDQALGQLAMWRAQDDALRGLYVAVNLSAVQLHDERLVDLVDEALARHDLPGRSLCLEVTESAAMRDPDGAAAILTTLRGLDVRVAMDDFGTEYSSLAYLQRFPIESLKIDRSFVKNLDGSDSADASLVAAIIAMAHALGIATIAEGVETPAQAAHIIALDCDSVQGFLYSRPVQAEQVPHLVRALGTGSANHVALVSPERSLAEIA